MKQKEEAADSDIQEFDMITRTDVEKREYLILSERACKAAESKGRKEIEEECTLRTCFQRDRDRIVHSKSFRRLMHKTQVFIAAEKDHFRTRLTHTIEVSQIARTISRGLGLNEDLTEAIALGHDLGHTPFGHNGEAVLNRIHEGGFKHNEQSLRVVDYLEGTDTRRGMNLCYEVRDGILNHTGPVRPVTLEGQVVKISDRIAYINHDIDDALRSGVISEKDLPKDAISYLGNTHGDRIDTLVKDLILESENSEYIVQSEDCARYMNELRNFMFANVYHNEKVKKNEELQKIDNIIATLYEYYSYNPKELPYELYELMEIYDAKEMAKDYVAGMTDRYSTLKYKEIIG